MKKVTILLTTISIIVSVAAFLIIRKTDKIVAEISVIEVVNNSINANSKAIESSIDDYSGKHTYYYEAITLNQKQFIEVNDCMQFYINDESFENSKNCQEKIVDAILEDHGELNFIKSIAGDMLNYSKETVLIDNNYLKNLIISSKRSSYLKEKLITAFINRYRDPAKLKATYNTYKVYFYNYIPKLVYDKVYKDYINSFIDSYDEIHKNDDTEAFYKAIYFKAEKLNKQSDYWAYTFWKRRELEKNDQILYSILNAINAHYNK